MGWGRRGIGLVVGVRRWVDGCGLVGMVLLSVSEVGGERGTMCASGGAGGGIALWGDVWMS